MQPAVLDKAASTGPLHPDSALPLDQSVLADESPKVLASARVDFLTWLQRPRDIEEGKADLIEQALKHFKSAEEAKVHDAGCSFSSG